MKLLTFLLLVVLTGCSTYPKERVQIVHDYIFYNAIKVCKPYQGFHYVVAKTTITDDKDTCHEEIKFRCQDGSLHKFDTGVEYCAISEMQLDETNRNVWHLD